MSSSLVLLLCVCCCCCLLLVAGKREQLDPEVNYSALQLITSKGYPGEEHWVTTSDGYILGLHRIPTGVKNKTRGPRPVFFLQHALLCSSTNWLTNLANESLAYILADHGFDVWMGNVRGNTYSRNHTTLKTNTREFWNFTFDQHSLKDLPAMLDYVISVTKQKELFYVGHSQGTIMGFAGFSTNQTLASYIKTFFALAPVTSVKHIKGAFKTFAGYKDEIAFIFNKLDHGEFLPNDFLIKFFAKDVCTAEMVALDLCGDIIFLVCGFDRANLNISRLPVYFTHTPAGTSVKNCEHLAQEVESGRFAMFDYGSKELNIREYGVSPSPSYNVSEIRVPMALFTGGQDWLADPTDVAEMIPIINTTGHVIYRKNIEYYNHLDFVYGMDAADMVYKDIIHIAQEMLKV